MIIFFSKCIKNDTYHLEAFHLLLFIYHSSTNWAHPIRIVFFHVSGTTARASRGVDGV